MDEAREDPGFKGQGRGENTPQTGSQERRSPLLEEIDLKHLHRVLG